MSFLPRRKPRPAPAMAKTTVEVPRESGISMRDSYRDLFNNPRGAENDVPNGDAPRPADSLQSFYRDLFASSKENKAQQQASGTDIRLAQRSEGTSTQINTANKDEAGIPRTIPPLQEIELPGVGKTHLDPETATAVTKWIDLNKQKGISVNFTSGFRPTDKQRKLQRDPKAITPAKPGTSLHEAGRAVDIDLDRIDDATLQFIIQNARKAGLHWGGDFTKKPDPIHFYQEVPEGRQKRSEHIRRRQTEYEQWLKKQQNR